MAALVSHVARRGAKFMPGLMQDQPLNLNRFVWRAEKLFFDKEIITYSVKGRQVTKYGDWAVRTHKLVDVLDKLGISRGGRVGTFGWNSANHLELFFAIPCAGRVSHTLNIRLFPEQLTYVVNHAEDEVIFVDRSLLPLLTPLLDTFKTVKHFVVMDDGKPNPIPNDPRFLDYEQLMASATPQAFREGDEKEAAGLCYTSGTTGNPKGVVYTHRSQYLHTIATLMSDSVGICERDVVLPVVPMFHANAWGLAHSVVASGATCVMPGPLLQPKPLADMIVNEKVTVAAGVPTIWMAMLPELAGRAVPALRSLPCGGSAVAKSLSVAYRKSVGLPILQAWGMTETSPVATMGRLASDTDALSDDDKDELRTAQGRPLPGVELRIVSEEGKELSWDGKVTGELQCRGPWIASAYYDRPDASDSFTSDGWLRTGDVARITPKGYVYLVDRTKDLIKSGGEWVSSVELENAIMAHPKVKEAAVIGVKSKKWMERPMACIVLNSGQQLTREELNKFLEDKVSHWWHVDALEVMDAIPRTSVGKFSKLTLRKMFENVEVA